MIFTEKPKDFNKQIDVAGCFVFYEGKFLLLQRQPHKTHGNKWGLPAGKIDNNETVYQAVKREIAEESGISLSEEAFKTCDLLHVRHDKYDLDWYMLSTYLSTLPNVVLNPQEHQNFRWVSKDDALNMDLIHDLDECIEIFFKDNPQPD